MPSGNGHTKPAEAIITVKPVVRTEMEVLEVLNSLNDMSQEGRLLFTDMSYEEGALRFYRWLTNLEAPNPAER